MGKNKRSISRIIVLSDDINSKTVGEVISDIMEYNFEDEDIEISKRLPIKLILNSFGGNVYDGFGLVGAIEGSQTPIHVNVLGSAMSMGLLIAACCHVRTCSRLTTFMYHGISYGVKDSKISNHKLELEEGERLQKMYNNVLKKYTKIPSEAFLPLGQEVYWDAKQAKEFKIIDSYF